MARPKSLRSRRVGRHLVHFTCVGAITDAGVGIPVRGFLTRHGGEPLGEPFLSKRGGYGEVRRLLSDRRIVPHQARFARRRIAASRLPEKDPFVTDRPASARHETQQLSAAG